MCSEMLPSRSESVSGQLSKNDPVSPLGLRLLRPYQREIALTLPDSVFNRKGRGPARIILCF